MTRVYDFSVTDIREHNFEFGEMTQAEIAEKKKMFEEYQKNKVTTPPPTSSEEKKTGSDAPKPAKPVFKPKIKPPGQAPS